MSVVANSSTVSTRKPNYSQEKRVIIKPRKQTPTSWQMRLPIWFLYLRSLQRRLGIATYILIAGMLVVYSSTVYLQQKWSEEYRKLENLQRYERQLTTANEVIKNQLAKEAEQPATELIPPNPGDAIILRSSSPKGDRSSSKLDAQPKIDIPSGY